jgi:hypothetical protein
MSEYKTPVKYIIFTFKEGTKNEKYPYPYVTTSFCHADEVLTEWSKDAPKGGAYDKVYFDVEWMDGSKYEGRFDLHHFSEKQETSSGRISLSEHIQDFVKGAEIVTEPEIKEVYLSVKAMLDKRCIDDKCSSKTLTAIRECEEKGGSWDFSNNACKVKR